jgi:hypothetical protein
MYPDQNTPQPTNPTNPVPQAPQVPQPTPYVPAQPNVANPLAAMQPGEQVIAEINRHPIGLIGNYIMAGILLALAAVAVIAVPNLVSQDTRHNAIIWGSGSFVIFAAFVFLAIYITTKVYKGNCWIVTDDSLTQVNQVSLFSRQSSQLSLHNLEDVTVQQNGIIQSALNFGTLRAETAGERSKFVFPYCPNPNARAREILLAREKFMGEGGYSGRNTGPAENPSVNITTQD